MLSFCRINDRVISANNISLEGVDYATAVQVSKGTLSLEIIIHNMFLSYGLCDWYLWFDSYLSAITS